MPKVRDPWAVELSRALINWNKEHGFARQQLAIELDEPFRRLRSVLDGDSVGINVADSEIYAKIHALTNLPQADPTKIPPHVRTNRDGQSEEIRRAWTDEEYLQWLEDKTVPQPPNKPPKPKPQRRPYHRRKKLETKTTVSTSVPVISDIPETPHDSGSDQDRETEQKDAVSVEPQVKAAPLPEVNVPPLTVGDLIGNSVSSLINPLVNAFALQVASHIAPAQVQNDPGQINLVLQTMAQSIQQLAQMQQVQQQLIANMQQMLLNNSSASSSTISPDEVFSLIKRLLEYAPELRVILADKPVVLPETKNDYEQVKQVKDSLRQLKAALNPFWEVDHPERRDYLLPVIRDLLGEILTKLTILSDEKSQREEQLKNMMTFDFGDVR